MLLNWHTYAITVLEPGEQDASEERQLIEAEGGDTNNEGELEAANSTDLKDNEPVGSTQEEEEQSNKLNHSATDDAKADANYCQETEVIAVEVQAPNRSNSNEQLQQAIEDIADKSNSNDSSQDGSGHLTESVEVKPESINSSDQQSIGCKLWKEERWQLENDSDNRSSGRSSIVIAINDDSHANSAHIIIRVEGDEIEDKKDDETEIDVGIDSDEEDEDDSNDQRELLLHKKNEKNNLSMDGGCDRIRYKHHFVEDEEDEQDDDIIVIVDEDNNLCGGGGVSDELYLKLREMGW